MISCDHLVIEGSPLTLSEYDTWESYEFNDW